MLDMCMDFTWSDVPSAADSKMGMAWRFKPHPGSSDGTHGVLVALDMVSHKPLWTERMRAAPLSSFLATGGGLVFGGNSDRSFQARDDKTGKVLWETRLSGPPSATPVTFSIDGHQYVAISTGGGASHEADTMPVAPEFAPGAPATTVWVFGLD
jgi:alcohol dehydrogenase (cytochrome c)